MIAFVLLSAQVAQTKEIVREYVESRLVSPGEHQQKGGDFITSLKNNYLKEQQNHESALFGRLDQFIKLGRNNL